MLKNQGEVVRMWEDSVSFFSIDIIESMNQWKLNNRVSKTI